MSLAGVATATLVRGVLTVATCVGLVVAATAAGPAVTDQAQPEPTVVRHGGEVIANSYLVTVADADPYAVAADHERRGARVERVFSRALTAYTARMSPELAAEVAADPRVRAVVADRRIRASEQVVPPGVLRVGAAASSTRTGDGAGEVDADIAILDTGIDVDHPDLRVAGGVDCVAGGVFAPGQEEEPPSPAPRPAAPESPAAEVAPPEDPEGPSGEGPAPGAGEGAAGSYDDARGHGTHIAGIAAARDDGTGVAGVAPGARLWAVRVLDADGNGSLGTLICGIEWVTERAEVIDVANMSLTGLDVDLGCTDGALHEALCRSVAAGVTYTVAAGNAASDAAGFSPAAYAEVITVSALADYDGRPGGLAATPPGCPGIDDAFAPFSNHGDAVDLIAPGVCIRSTWPGGGYRTLSGTSQAAAHVAGAAALVLAANPAASPAQVRDLLRARGSLAWAIDGDPDGVPDPLLDVAQF